MRKKRIYTKTPETIARINYILEAVANGELQINIAKKLGITRERVRQIYTKNAVVPYSKQRLNIVNEAKEKRISELKTTIHFNCSKCGRPVYAIENDKYVKAWKICSNCRGKKLALTKKICDWCGIEYFPFASSMGLNTALNFHVNTCYFSFLKTYKKSIYRVRLTEQTKTNRYLTKKVEKLTKIIIQMRRETLTGSFHPSVLNLTIPKYKNKTSAETTKLGHQMPYKPGTCLKCTILITGEFIRYKSKIDPNLCKGCDGSKFEIENSVLKSGLVSGVAFGRRG